MHSVGLIGGGCKYGIFGRTPVDFMHVFKQGIASQALFGLVHGFSDTYTESEVGFNGSIPLQELPSDRNAYHLQAQEEKTNNKKRQKRDPTQGEDTPFTDDTFLKLQPRNEGTLHESMAKFVNRELRQLQAVHNVFPFHMPA